MNYPIYTDGLNKKSVFIGIKYLRSSVVSITSTIRYCANASRKRVSQRQYDNWLREQRQPCAVKEFRRKRINHAWVQARGLNSPRDEIQRRFPVEYRHFQQPAPRSQHQRNVSLLPRVGDQFVIVLLVHHAFDLHFQGVARPGG